MSRHSIMSEVPFQDAEFLIITKAMYLLLHLSEIIQIDILFINNGHHTDNTYWYFDNIKATATHKLLVSNTLLKSNFRELLASWF